MQVTFTVEKTEIDDLFKAGNINPYSELASRIRKALAAGGKVVVTIRPKV